MHLLATPLEKEHVDYKAVPNNVAYSSVAALAFSSPDEKVSYGESPEQYALFSRAKSSSKVNSTHLIVLIHGGCWLSAYDISHSFALSTGLSQAGFNVWSLEYRRTGDEGGGWPNTFEDIKLGIQASTQFNDGEFPIQNTILLGHSAGGQLALLAGADNPDLSAVFGLAAITDIEQYAVGDNSCQKATKGFMNGLPKEQPEAYKLANPIYRNLHHNTVLLHGSKDKIVPPHNLTTLNKPIVMLEGAGHFDWIHPGSQAFTKLVQELQRTVKQ